MIGLCLRPYLQRLDHLIDIPILGVLIVEDGDDCDEDVEDDADIANEEDYHESDPEVHAFLRLGDVFEGETT
jgi:hypothetical protein